MWRSKVKLNDGETLKHVSSRSKGPLAEEDITEYSILNSEGQVVGTVIHKDHQAIKGSRRTQSVYQTDTSHKVIVEENWTN